MTGSSFTYRPLAWSQRFLAAILPTISLSLALIFDAVPLISGSWALAVPGFVPSVLFFWSVYQPRSVPLLFIFILGLGTDMIDHTPLGVTALSYMILCLGAKSQSQTLSTLGFLFNWAVFSLMIICFGLVKFALSVIGTPGVFDHSLAPAALRVVQFVLTTIGTYFAFHVVLGAFNRLLSPQSDFEGSKG